MMNWLFGDFCYTNNISQRLGLLHCTWKFFVKVNSDDFIVIPVVLHYQNAPLALISSIKLC